MIFTCAAFVPAWDFLLSEMLLGAGPVVVYSDFIENNIVSLPCSNDLPVGVDALTPFCIGEIVRSVRAVGDILRLHNRFYNMAFFIIPNAAAR